MLAINEAPEKYRPLFVEKGRIPPFMAADYPIPKYPPPAPFDRIFYEPVIDWLVSKELSANLPYEIMVSTDFLKD